MLKVCGCTARVHFACLETWRCTGTDGYNSRRFSTCPTCTRPYKRLPTSETHATTLEDRLAAIVPRLGARNANARRAAYADLLIAIEYETTSLHCEKHRVAFAVPGLVTACVHTARGSRDDVLVTRAIKVLVALAANFQNKLPLCRFPGLLAMCEMWLSKPRYSDAQDEVLQLLHRMCNYHDVARWTVYQHACLMDAVINAGKLHRPLLTNALSALATMARRP